MGAGEEFLAHPNCFHFARTLDDSFVWIGIDSSPGGPLDGNAAGVTPW